MSRECNEKIVEHEKSIVTQWNIEKSEKEECTRMHKRITGCPLTDLYRKVVHHGAKLRKERKRIRKL